MSWNYRVVKIEEPGDEPLLMLREVYYTATGGLKAHRAPRPIEGVTFKEIQEEFDKMQSALRMPALDAGHFTG